MGRAAAHAGDGENRIKECQLDLFADRTSAATMAVNQLRLWVAGLALCAAICSAPHRLGKDAVGHGDFWLNPAETAEDWCFGADQRAPGGVRHGVGLFVAVRVRAGTHGTATKQPVSWHEAARA
jgi:hypothetical protein